MSNTEGLSWLSRMFWIEDVWLTSKCAAKLKFLCRENENPNVSFKKAKMCEQWCKHYYWSLKAGYKSTFFYSCSILYCCEVVTMFCSFAKSYFIKFPNWSIINRDNYGLRSLPGLNHTHITCVQFSIQHLIWEHAVSHTISSWVIMQFSRQYNTVWDLDDMHPSSQHWLKN